MDAALDAGGEASGRAVAECWAEAASAEQRWFSAVQKGGPAGRGAHGRSWARLNHVAGMPRT
jgi:hypothetical protein